MPSHAPSTPEDIDRDRPHSMSTTHLSIITVDNKLKWNATSISLQIIIIFFRMVIAAAVELMGDSTWNEMNRIIIMWSNQSSLRSETNLL